MNHVMHLQTSAAVTFRDLAASAAQELAARGVATPYDSFKFYPRPPALIGVTAGETHSLEPSLCAFEHVVACVICR
jgi:hypothetical protein